MARDAHNLLVSPRKHPRAVVAERRRALALVPLNAKTKFAATDALTPASGPAGCRMP